MIVHNLNQHPNKNVSYNYGTPSELYLGDASYDEIWYNYAQTGYEGEGTAIFRNGNFYASCGLGHCSCYGPDENFPDLKEFEPLDDLEKRYSVNPEYYKEVKWMFDIIRGLC